MVEEYRTWLWSHDSFCPHGSRQAAQLQCGTCRLFYGLSLLWLFPAAWVLLC